MEETLVFMDEGFLDKLTKLFGDAKRVNVAILSNSPITLDRLGRDTITYSSKKLLLLPPHPSQNTRTVKHTKQKPKCHS